jgi:hypothetical protein
MLQPHFLKEQALLCHSKLSFGLKYTQNNQFLQYNNILAFVILQPHNLQNSYSVQLWGYPLSICGYNIHPFHKLGKRKL